MALRTRILLWRFLLVGQLLVHSITCQGEAERFSNGTCVWGINGFPLSPASSICPLPVDEYTAFHSGQWSPWSHRPECTTPMDDYSPQYCLFTDDTFRGGQGISIFTTAEIAADVANALDDANVPPSLRDVPFGLAEAAYRVTDIPGRGKSVIATRRIKALETIIMGYPALVTINDIEGASYDEIMSLLQKAVDQLQSPGRDSVNSLARSNGDESHVRDVIRTNSFGLDLGDVEHMGVFPGTSVRFSAPYLTAETFTDMGIYLANEPRLQSKVGKSCMEPETERANPDSTYYRLLPHALAQQVIARRDIEAGEEITHSCKSP